MPASPSLSAASAIQAPSSRETTVLGILFAISLSHGINDTIQAVLPSVYPMLRDHFSLTFTQIGLITLAAQLTASLLQPFVGMFTDRHPLPFSLAAGMGLMLLGLALLAFANSFPAILVAAAIVGMGSSIFHPEASRVARLASGGRYGFAQSFFQVGGNAGTALGPLLAALIIIPRGQPYIAWFCLLAVVGGGLLAAVGRWYARRLATLAAVPAARTASGVPVTVAGNGLSRGTVVRATAVLAVLVFSKYFYLISMTNYLTFYLMDRFHLPKETANVYLFIFLAAVAVGTLIGGPVGDRLGRRVVIWVSILGVAPFSLVLPHVGLGWTCALSVIAGLILASAFSAIVVYAQELVPGRVGLISGLFFGFAFGMGGIGAATLGALADHTSIRFVFEVCAFLPLLGLLTALLPDTAGATPASSLKLQEPSLKED